MTAAYATAYLGKVKKFPGLDAFLRQMGFKVKHKLPGKKELRAKVAMFGEFIKSMGKQQEEPRG
ncbi:MAG: hypothetical protein IIA59_00675 [Candidatus Marinimicrobia bacterium]|nr:hypothetical protein [Candidatus Neomarinimicrobiota bacterium]